MWNKTRDLCLNEINLVFKRFVFKGHLRYKTVTSQNVSSEAQRQRIFLFHRKVMFRSRDIQVFVFLTIP